MVSKRDLDLAYAAGVMDSDGTIGVRFNPPGPAFGAQGCYQPRIGIRQVENQAIDLLQELFGGHRAKRANKWTPNGRPLFEWRAICKIACKALEEMLPYLRIKKSQAEHVIEIGKLNAMPRFRPVLLIDESEGWISLRAASELLAVSHQNLKTAMSKGRIPSRGHRSTREVPLATVKQYVQLKPGGTPRPADQSAELRRRYLAVRELNQVGINAKAGT